MFGGFLRLLSILLNKSEKKMNTERKIGEYIVVDKQLLEVVESPNKDVHCDGCFFIENIINCNSTTLCDFLGRCCGENRSDKKNVIFKHIGIYDENQ